MGEAERGAAPRDYAVGVCGFPRCGSSMLMRMLDMGGLAPVEGSSDRGYELPDGFEQVAGWHPDRLRGRAIKLLDYPQWFDMRSLPDVPWRFIWADRNSKQQALSTVKFLGGVAGLATEPDAAARFRASFDLDRPGILAALSKRGEVLRVRYESVLSNPVYEAQRLAAFCDIDPYKAARVVHQRRPECAPDLAFEYGSDSMVTAVPRA